MSGKRESEREKVLDTLPGLYRAKQLAGRLPRNCALASCPASLHLVHAVVHAHTVRTMPTSATGWANVCAFARGIIN